MSDINGWVGGVSWVVNLANTDINFKLYQFSYDNCHIILNFLPACLSLMFTRRNHSKSIGGITRDKTSRAFGQDVTHYYNNQSSNSREEVQISCFGFMTQKPKYIVESPEDKVSNSTQGSAL